MPKTVLDASAVLALLRGEKGWDVVAEALSAASISAVNAAEVFTKLAEWNTPETGLDRARAVLADTVVPFDPDQAYRTGMLRPQTKDLGLSLGDRACLALAIGLGARVLTADKVWAKLKLDLPITVIR